MNDSHLDEIMPDTGGCVLCYKATKPVSLELYNDYIQRAKKCIEAHGEFRLLIYYKDFPGWDSGAASQDVSFYSEYGKFMKKLCLVNPPDKEITAKVLRKNIIGGEMRIFPEARLQEALDWVKS